MSDSSNKNENLKDSEIEAPNFDWKFQAGLLNLALKDDYFCSQLVRYLGQDNDLAEHQVFANPQYHFIFGCIVKSFEEYKTRPEESQIRTSILAFDEHEREPYFIGLEQILKAQVHNEAFYRSHITAFVLRIKMAKGIKDSRKVSKENPNDAPDHLQKVLDGIKRIKFEKEDVLELNSVYSLVQKDKDNTAKIPTGLKRLDEDLGGGFPRETLVTVLGGSNSGKSIFCNSLGCSALRNGSRVLHINLEGTRDEVVYRYLSNLADVEFKNIEEQTLTELEKEKVDNAVKKYNENLKIRNMLNFGITIEEVIAYCRECYKNFQFDVIIVDYGQLLKTKQKGADKGFDRQTEAYRGLDSLSKEFRCVVISPAQSNREGMKKQNDFGKFSRPNVTEALPVLRSADLADCIEIARVSAVILTLNRTEEEEVRGWVRVFLEKQRRGRKAITYGVKAKYAKSNLIVNDYYDPNSLVHKSTEDFDEEERQQKKNTSEVTLASMTEEKKEAFSSEIQLKDIIASDNPDEFSYNTLVLEYDNLLKEKRDVDANFDKLKDIKNVQLATQRLVKIRDRKKEIKKEAKELIYKFIPKASPELYKLTKESAKDLKNSSNPGTLQEQAKSKLYMKQLDLVFGDE
jgi:replicative DNA helicase